MAAAHKGPGIAAASDLKLDTDYVELRRKRCSYTPFARASPRRENMERSISVSTRKREDMRPGVQAIARITVRAESQAHASSIRIAGFGIDQNAKAKKNEKAS
jgi:hypothetical protein